MLKSARFLLLPLAAAASLLALPVFAALNDPPVVKPETLRRVAPGVSIIPDPRINYVPNIGIIEGRAAILVIDTGMGATNGRLVYERARAIARGRRIYLTTTHFHPEHSFGASAFPGASFIQNRAQAAELAEKGEAYLALFRSFGTVEQRALADVQLVRAGITYSGRKWLDLGGRKVLLWETPAHTRGDQLVYVPESGVVFTGDLVEDRFFPIMPDGDARGSQWIAVTREIAGLKPKIVVPGHGRIGTIALVRATQAYLEHVRTAVYALADRGLSQAAITRDLSPKLKALHPDWDNSVFIPYEIAIFYAERTGKPVQLPELTSDLQSDKKS